MNHNEQDDLERQAVTGESVERGGARPLTDDELATLRPGDRVVLDRFIPATSAGPARRFAHVLTIEELSPLGGDDGWTLASVECDEHRGFWHIGTTGHGMVTTLSRAPEAH